MDCRGRHHEIAVGPWRGRGHGVRRVAGGVSRHGLAVEPCARRRRALHGRHRRRCGPFGVPERTSRYFAPAVLFLSYSAFGVGVRGIINLVTKTSRIQNAIDPTSITFAALSTRIFLYGLLGTVAFAVGERLARRRRARASPACAGPPLPAARMRWVLASAMGVTVGAVAFLVWRLGAVVFLNPSYAAVRGGFGLFWLYPLLYSAIFAWSLGIADRWTRGMRPSWWQFLGLAGSALTVYAVTSAKAALVNAVIIPVVLYHYTVRPVRWRYIFIPALVFMLVLPALYLYREVGADAQLLQHLSVKQMLGGGQILLGRSYLADSFGAVLAYTPRVYGFQYGRPWLKLLYFWIPRAFWPSKPVTSSIAFGQTYLSAYREGSLSFMSPTLLGDAYMNFGALGILVVFLGVGYGLRRWYDATIGSRPRCRAAAGVCRDGILDHYLAGTVARDHG